LKVGGRGGSSNWLDGRTNWTVDYPKGHRTFAAALRRLTRIDIRSVEQPVNPDDGDDIFTFTSACPAVGISPMPKP
jgi:hypothetical protein